MEKFLQKIKFTSVVSRKNVTESSSRAISLRLAAQPSNASEYLTNGNLNVFTNYNQRRLVHICVCLLQNMKETIKLRKWFYAQSLWRSNVKWSRIWKAQSIKTNCKLNSDNCVLFGQPSAAPTHWSYIFFNKFCI